MSGGDWIGGLLHVAYWYEWSRSSALIVLSHQTEIGKNERDRRSFPFSSVQFMNLAHILADF